jgi:predicted outer membrane repeat protein
LKTWVLVLGLTVLLLGGALTALGGVRGVGEVAAQPLPNVGINGDPCYYADIRSALPDAQDGDTIYVDVREIHTGTVIGLVDKSVTIAAATNDCQTPTSTTAIVNGGGYYDYKGAMLEIFQSNAITLSHVRLENTRAYRGGLVYVDSDSTLRLEASELASGTAQAEGGGIYVGVGATLIMTDGSKIYSNEVTDTFSSGAGISAYSSTITMTNSQVGGIATSAGNVSANQGGGVALDRAKLYLHNSPLLNNIASTEGGGLFAFNESEVQMRGTSSIGDPNFVALGNYAEHGGGAYLVSSSGIVMYDRSLVGLNSAAGYGGGVYATSGSYVTLRDGGTRIYGNVANFGGGVYLSGTNSVLNLFSGAQIEANEALPPITGAPAHGGGVYATGQASVYGGPAQFIDNYAAHSGGGIYLAQNGALAPTGLALVDGSLMQGNSAQSGGAIYLAEDGANAIIDGSRVVDNDASNIGGGIYVFADNELQILNGSVISGNEVTTEHGGGIAMVDGRTIVANSEIRHNTAITEGGGVQQTGGVLTLTNAVIADNEADYGGGIASLNSSELRMHTDFNACDPWSQPAHVYCSEMRGNLGAEAGGGLYVQNSSVVLSATAFLDNVGQNSGTSPGAAVFIGKNAHVSATNALFSDNGKVGNTAVHVYIDATYYSDQSTYAGNHDTPLYAVSSSEVNLYRNIIWDNAGDSFLPSGSVAASYCNDVQNLAPLTGPTNISTDPQFVTTTRGPYRITVNSPVVDYCAGRVNHDLDGSRRPINGAAGISNYDYDIGAFEAPVPVFLPLVVRIYP